MNQKEFKVMQTHWETLKMEMHKPTPNNENIKNCMDSMDKLIREVKNKDNAKKLSSEEKEKKMRKQIMDSDVNSHIIPEIEIKISNKEQCIETISSLEQMLQIRIIRKTRRSFISFKETGQ